MVYHLAGQPGRARLVGQRTSRRTSPATCSPPSGCSRPRATRRCGRSSTPRARRCTATPRRTRPHENLTPRPVSPYGVTKLAAEHLCELYRTTSGVPTVSLRLFTVYGPAAAAGHGVLPAGRPRRSPAARSCSTATASRAATSPTSTTSWPPCGRRRCRRGPAWRTSAAARRTTMNARDRQVGELARPIEMVRLPAQRGDVRHTAADTTVAREGFGYHPRVTLGAGPRPDGGRGADGLPTDASWGRPMRSRSREVGLATRPATGGARARGCPPAAASCRASRSCTSSPGSSAARAATRCCPRPAWTRTATRRGSRRCRAVRCGPGRGGGGCTDDAAAAHARADRALARPARLPWSWSG